MSVSHNTWVSTKHCMVVSCTNHYLSIFWTKILISKYWKGLNWLSQVLSKRTLPCSKDWLSQALEFLWEEVFNPEAAKVLCWQNISYPIPNQVLSFHLGWKFLAMFFFAQKLTIFSKLVKISNLGLTYEKFSNFYFLWKMNRQISNPRPLSLEWNFFPRRFDETLKK